MKSNQLNYALSLFKAIALMEDSVDPGVKDKESPESAFAKVKEAVKEKRALIKRTHVCELTLYLESTAKPVVVSAGNIFDMQWDDQTERLAITLATTDPDGDVSYPSGMITIPLSDIIRVEVSNTKEAVMAAISNQAIATNSSSYAKQIVDLLGLQPIVDSVKAKAAPVAQTSSLQVMWFPVYGWYPTPLLNSMTALQSDLDPAFPLTPFAYSYSDAKTTRK